MQLDAIIEVAIGLVFVWLVISIATMEAYNRIGGYLGWRAKHLEKSIHSMLKDKALVDRFYAHPLVAELMLKNKKGDFVKDRQGKPVRPDYIPNQVFATAAFEVIMNAGKGKKDIPVDSLSLSEMTANLKSLMAKNEVLPYVFPNMEKSMKTLQRNTHKFEEKIAEYHGNMEGWFDNVMTQSSNWYKIRAQWLAFWIGLALAIIFNIDTIFVAQKLWQEPTIRAVIVAQAQAEAQKDSPADIVSVKNLNFPIGWMTTQLESTSCSWVGVVDSQLIFGFGGKCFEVTSFTKFTFWSVFVKLIGYFITAFAAAQGAPFWFDILRKLVGVKQQIAPAPK